MSDSANSTVNLNGTRNFGVLALLLGGLGCVAGMVMNDKVTNYNSGTSFGVGIRHRF